MARPRNATDGDMIATAESLARELGSWRKVFGSTVAKRMGVGGSLSTYTDVMNEWRKKKAEGEEVSKKTSVSEVTTNRPCIIDDGITEIANTLNKMRETVTQDAERAVADERRKCDGIRKDERDTQEKIVAEYREELAGLQEENAMLSTEAQEEEARADAAEKALEEMTKQAGVLRAEAEKVPALIDELSSARAAAEKAEKKADAAIAKAEADFAKAELRENTAVETSMAKGKTIENLWQEIKSVHVELSTTRSDLSAACAEIASKTRELNAATHAIEVAVKRAYDSEAAATEEKMRADNAWSQVEMLEKKFSDLLKRFESVEA